MNFPLHILLKFHVPGFTITRSRNLGLYGISIDIVARRKDLGVLLTGIL